MAKIIVDSQEIVAVNFWVRFNTVLIGLAMGFAWWLLWAMGKQYALDVPASLGGVAHVLVFIIGLFSLIRLHIARPLLIALASAVMLWPIGDYLSGMSWGESLIWSVCLYAASYGLFYLVAQLRRLWASVLTTVLILVAAVIALVL